MNQSMAHLDYLGRVAQEDVQEILRKEKTYKGSWKARGGVGAFMMLARKWDRLEGMLTGARDGVGVYDIFGAILAETDAPGSELAAPPGEDGTVLAEIRDLRRYLLLVEAEMMAQGVIGDQVSRFEAKTYSEPAPVPIEDSNRHAERAVPKLRYTLTHLQYDQLDKDKASLYYAHGRDYYRLWEYIESSTSALLMRYYIPLGANQWIIDRRLVEGCTMPFLRKQLTHMELGEVHPKHYRQLYVLQTDGHYYLRSPFNGVEWTG